MIYLGATTRNSSTVFQDSLIMIPASDLSLPDLRGKCHARPRCVHKCSAYRPARGRASPYDDAVQHPRQWVSGRNTTPRTPDAGLPAPPLDARMRANSSMLARPAARRPAKARPPIPRHFGSRRPRWSRPDRRARQEKSSRTTAKEDRAGPMGHHDGARSPGSRSEKLHRRVKCRWHTDWLFKFKMNDSLACARESP